MSDFIIKVLSAADGSWDAFKADWTAQCEQVGDTYEEYATDALGVIEGIACGSTTALEGTSEVAVGALWDQETGRYYAACVLNRAMLPGTSGYTLRVRQITVSPLLDYGVAEVRMYPDVVIGLVLGIIQLSSTVMQSNNLRMHLRSPEDMAFFRVFANALDGRKAFASVQIRGSWLYIEKVGAVGTATAKEAE